MIWILLNLFRVKGGWGPIGAGWWGMYAFYHKTPGGFKEPGDLIWVAFTRSAVHQMWERRTGVPGLGNPGLRFLYIVQAEWAVVYSVWISREGYNFVTGLQKSGHEGVWVQARSPVFWKDPKAGVYHVNLSVPLNLSGLHTGGSPHRCHRPNNLDCWEDREGLCTN